MTEAQFEHCLDLYGGALPQWPLAQRTAAETLLAESERARRAMAIMQEAESFLLASQPRDQAALVLRFPPRRPRLVLAARLGWSGMAAAMLLFGFVLGMDAPHAEDDPSLSLAKSMAAGEMADVD